jgi:hypothetical protein
MQRRPASDGPKGQGSQSDLQVGRRPRYFYLGVLLVPLGQMVGMARARAGEISAMVFAILWAELSIDGESRPDDGVGSMQPSDRGARGPL